MKKIGIITMFAALILSTAVVSAQGWRSGRLAANNGGARQGTCINLLNDLSSEQKEKITQLIEAHQETMNELRTEQRSASDPLKRNEIRGEMIKKVQAHRNEVRNLLTEEQQKQLDVLQNARQNRVRGYAAARGNFRGRGCCCRQGFRGGW